MYPHLSYARQARRALLPLCVPEPPAGLGRFELPEPRLWLRWACDQGLAALLWANLKNRGDLYLLNDEASECLGRYAWECAFRSQVAEEAMAGIAQCAVRSGVEVMFLKGAALARRYYPQVHNRPVNDVDIYVREEDLPGMASIMESLNYERTWVDASEWAYTSKEQPLPVEIHWRFVNNRRLRENLREESQALWDNAITLDLPGGAVRTLGNDDAFRHACVHAAQHHQFSRLIWLVDMLQIIRAAASGNMTVAGLAGNPQSSGERMAIYGAMRILADLFPWASECRVSWMRPRQGWASFLHHRLTADSVLTPDSRLTRYRRKLFRKALKRHE